MRVLGLSSGTSLDAIDTALVELDVEQGTMRLSVIDWTESPWPVPLQAQLRHLADPAVSVPPRDLALASMAAGEAFAAAASSAVRAAGLVMEDVAFIASHGQTVADRDRAEAALQQAGLDAKLAILIIGRDLDVGEAQRRLTAAQGRPRTALQADR